MSGMREVIPPREATCEEVAKKKEVVSNSRVRIGLDNNHSIGWTKVLHYSDGAVGYSILETLAIKQQDTLLSDYEKYVNAVKDGDWNTIMDKPEPFGFRSIHGGAKYFYGNFGHYDVGVRDVCEKSELSKKAELIRIEVLGTGDESALPLLWGKDYETYIMKHI